MFQSLFFFPWKTTRFHIDGRKIIKSSENVKGPWDVWFRKEKEKGSHLPKTVGYSKGFLMRKMSSNKKQAQMSGH